MALLIVLWVMITYFASHFLVITSITKIFGISFNIYFFIGTLVSIFLPVFCMIVHRFSDNAAWKLVYILGMTYVWSVVISSYVFAFYRLIALKYDTPMFWYISGIIALSLIGFSLYSGRHIAITEITLETPKTQKEVKIAYMSDIHIDGINDGNYVKRIVAHINEIKPDMVLINGDLVDGTTLSETHFEWFKAIQVPIYATLWNHEWYRWVPYVEKLLSQTNIQLLKDQMIEVNGIQILGSDEISSRRQPVDLSWLQTFLSGAKIDDKKPALLLIHEPVGMQLAQTYPIDMQLAWHTHNGQIWPLWYVAQFLYGYKYGMYYFWNMKFYVSSGTALWWPPLRLATKNEIVVITIKP